MDYTVTNIFGRQMTILSRVVLPAEDQNGDNIKTITIGEFLDPEWQSQYKDEILVIRSLCPTLEEKLQHEKDVNAMKKSLPAGIVSGVAVDGIGEHNIVERNGVIAFDVDAQDNLELYDWEAVKDEISKSPFVAYVGLSVTGLGNFGLIPIENPMKHKEHFEAIVSDFANTTFSVLQKGNTEPTIVHGIKLDPAPSNIASKRFVSYDPQPYWNTSAQVYGKTIEPVQLYERKNTTIYDGCFNVEDFFKAHNISYTMRERQGGIQYIVECPWSHLHSSHSKADSAVFEYPDGRLGYKCLHSHCSTKHWQEYREFYEPDAYSNRL